MILDPFLFIDIQTMVSFEKINIIGRFLLGQIQK